MSDKSNLPLGLALRRAGLISEEQLQKALELQSKYTEMKLGEILVLQEGIRAQTINFFVKKRQEIMAKGQQFPIGHYLKDASLLNARQVEIILEEQKRNKKKFGTIAVQKGWIAQDTIDFFLDTLSFKTPQLMSLGMLEEYNKKVLHLENKYANHSLILSRILAWTGGNATLTKTICHIFTNSDFNIPAGLEINAVDRFVEGSLIKNWQTSRVGTYLRWVKQNLVSNQRCDSNLLLKEYQQILLSGSKNYLQTKEQDELLTLGLITKEDNQLRVANLIYQQVFNRDWIVERLQTRTNSSPNVNSNNKSTTTNVTEYVPSSSLVSSQTTQNDFAPENNTSTDSNAPSTNNKANSSIPEPLTKMSSLITLAAIALLIPLFLTINNYYSSLSKRKPDSDSNYSAEAEELEQFCAQIDYVDSNSSLVRISQIERKRRELLNNIADNSDAFPDNCNTALNRLRVLAAPQLGRESRVLEAIEHLCRIPADSEVYIDAEVWLQRWYNSSDWGQETKFYLQELSKYDDSGCPAAHFTEYEQ